MRKSISWWFTMPRANSIDYQAYRFSEKRDVYKWFGKLQITNSKSQINSNVQIKTLSE